MMGHLFFSCFQEVRVEILHPFRVFLSQFLQSDSSLGSVPWQVIDERIRKAHFLP